MKHFSVRILRTLNLVILSRLDDSKTTRPFAAVVPQPISSMATGKRSTAPHISTLTPPALQPDSQTLLRCKCSLRGFSGNLRAEADDGDVEG